MSLIELFFNKNVNGFAIADSVGWQTLSGTACQCTDHKNDAVINRYLEIKNSNGGENARL